MRGATEEELKRGITAAREAFLSTGINPHEAAAAAFKRKADGEHRSLNDEEAPSDTLSVREFVAADAWDKADYEAIHACCAGWAIPADDAGIVLLRQGEEPMGPVVEFLIDIDGALRASGI